MDNSQLLLLSLMPYGVGTEAGVAGYDTCGCVTLTDIKSYQAGLDKKDACFTAETDEYIVLSYRGTAGAPSLDNPKGIIDWLNNFAAKPIEVDGFPGKVHEGFYHSVDNLKDAIKDVKERMSSVSKPVLITGYSKGGGLAPLATWQLKVEGADPSRLKMVSFEGPRSGDKEFADAFDQLFPDAIRFEYQNDIVPHVPPTKLGMEVLGRVPVLGSIIKTIYPNYEKWNYWHAGELHFVDWQNQIIVGDSDKLILERFMHLVTEYKTALADHMPCDHIFPVLEGTCKPSCFAGCDKSGTDELKH